MLQRLQTIRDKFFRSSAVTKKSSNYKKLQITDQPENIDGYVSEVEDLISHQRFDEAKTKLQAVLDIHSNQFHLLNIASDLYRSLGDIVSKIKCSVSIPFLILLLDQLLKESNKIFLVTS